MDPKYSYLLFASLSLIPWLLLYLYRKDLRREMLITSVFLAVFGILAEYMWYTKDWWHPPTITGTVIGIEDLILGFGAGGVAAVLYKEIFHKAIYKYGNFKFSQWVLVLPLLLTFAVMHILFAYFGIFSFWANIIGFAVGLVLMSLLRPDLEAEALEGGLFVTLLAVPIYWIIVLLFPNWIQTYWDFRNVAGFMIMGIPYEELVWWFFAGAFGSIIYDYWFVVRLRSLKSSG